MGKVDLKKNASTSRTPRSNPYRKEFLTGQATIRFSKRTVLHGVSYFIAYFELNFVFRLPGVMFYGASLTKILRELLFPASKTIIKLLP